MGCMIYGVFLVSSEILTIGALISCIQMTNHITSPVYTLVDRISSFKSVKKIFSKIDSVENNNVIELSTNELLDDFINFKLDNISFNYDDKEILKSINYKFKNGKKYALVGLSGSGKSTILKLLFRIINSKNGVITINDKKIENIKYNSFINKISYIDQNIFVFSGSIYDNITLFNKKYSYNKVKDILNILGLEKFIPNISDENFISENGNNLSLGEKQRLSIARVLIREPQVILADEILASLDNENALKIENYLISNKNQTLISVTHRLIPEVLKKYDKIIVLKDGKIVEDDSLEKLLSSNSYFKKLYNFQITKNKFF